MLLSMILLWMCLSYTNAGRFEDGVLADDAAAALPDGEGSIDPVTDAYMHMHASSTASASADVGSHVISPDGVASISATSASPLDQASSSSPPRTAGSHVASDTPSQASSSSSGCKFFDVHAFYYPWYGNPAVDGKWLQWDHEIIPHWTPAITRQHPSGRYQPPVNFGAAHSPQRGLYSSSDPAVLGEHMRELAAAGVCVVGVSWWGQERYPESVDGQNVSTDRVMPLVLAAAAEHGVKVAFHLEPYAGRNPKRVREDIEYIVQHYGSSPAFFRDPHRGDRPLYYVYDSYHNPPAEWAELLSVNGALTVRNTSLDGDFIGLYLTRADEQPLIQAHFDGFYTYFASDGFTHGSSPRNWASIASWAAQASLLFIPCVGPGYDDTWVRPWNGHNTKSREHGAYYDRMFTAATALTPRAHAIAITSYNEWGEGTQIEPAVPYTSPAPASASSDEPDPLQQSKAYRDYLPNDPSFYMDRTKHWADVFHREAP